MSLTQRFGSCVVATALMLASSRGLEAVPSSRHQDVSDEAKHIQESSKTLDALTSAPDDRIPEALLARAEAIVVIPSLIKGGFVLGGKHGKGVMSVRDDATGTWSAPGFVKMTGGSIGWQIGVEEVDLVLLVMNRDGVDRLLSDKFTLGGSLSATAGPVGRSTEASTDAKISAQILAYSRSRGLFAGATFEGAALHPDGDAIERYYGKSTELRDVLAMRSSDPKLPPAVLAWGEQLHRIASPAASDTSTRR